MRHIEAHSTTGPTATPRLRIAARATTWLGLTVLFGSLMTGQAFSDPDQRGAADKVTLCHATGSETNPYSLITISENGLNGHDGHDGDIVPAPAGGCPGAVADPDPDKEKVTLCHATGSETNPYVVITIDENGLNGHGDHEGDIIPVPAGGCPGAVADPDSDKEKVTLCHATGSETNPYVVITIDENGLNGHGDHEGDIIPVPAGGCPVPTPPVTIPPTTVPTTVPTTLPTTVPTTATTTAPAAVTTPAAVAEVSVAPAVLGLVLESTAPPAASAPVAAPTSTVLGATLERSGQTLPRTGSGLTGLATLGLGLLVLGAALKLGSRPTPASVRPSR